MPFTEKKRRTAMLQGQLVDVQPGDLCFEKYQAMMDAWTKEKRWKTIDKLAEPILTGPDSRAHFLAFLVFMHFHGYKYEEQARKKNGDIKGRK